MGQSLGRESFFLLARASALVLCGFAAHSCSRPFVTQTQNNNNNNMVIVTVIRDCPQSNKNARGRVFLTSGGTCLLKVIQRLKHIEERNFLAFSMQDFISYHSYKSLILDSLFNRFLTRINSFLVAFQGRSKVLSEYRRTYCTKMYPIALMCWSPLSAP